MLHEPSKPEVLERLRQEAKERLGAKWVLHPDYRFQPHHSLQYIGVLKGVLVPRHVL